MSYSYPLVSVGNADFAVYGELEDADEYLSASITATKWAAATDDTKAKALVSAVRWLEGLNWLGQKADEDQTLEWPRSGITGVSSSVIPSGIVLGSFELAAALVETPDLFTSISDPGVRSLHAGEVSISYFRPADVQWTGVVPKAVLAYIKRYLASGGVAGAPVTSGVSDETVLGGDYGYGSGL